MKTNHRKTPNDTIKRNMSLLSTIAIMMLPASQVFAYTSGSTGSDGAFNPLVDTEVVLPADGIFNYTTINIPAGVTVTFRRNQVNTPVTWLATGDVTIDGKVILSGKNSPDVGAAGDGNVGDDGQPGLAGPGGFDGGTGGGSNSQIGSAGYGPGRGLPASGTHTSGSESHGCGGGGAGYFAAGSQSVSVAGPSSLCNQIQDGGAGGNAYGNLELLPLIGGSGGGGASGGFTTAGSGGGGGGGAILIASSTNVSINGELRADGGNSGSVGGQNTGGSGGAGSGGAIRIIATTISGNGVISASAGQAGTVPTSYTYTYTKGGNGADGRIRLEAENFLRTTGTTPGYSLATPGTLFIPGQPAVRISSVAAQTAPAIPTGNADIVLPITTTNPVTVNIASTGIPVGNVVNVTMIPATGNPVTVVSSALTGTQNAATATATIDLPTGPSILQAEVNYSVTAP